MHTGARYTDIADAIHIHPTLAEGVNTAAGGVHREIGPRRRRHQQVNEVDPVTTQTTEIQR
jgi:hypothetical protein